MGFQADKEDSPKTEQKETEQKKNDDSEEETKDQDKDSDKDEDKDADEDEDKDEDSDKDDEPDFLKIGSKAPALDLEYWPTDNNGLLPPAKKFESGKTYVLNFFQPGNEYSVGNLKSMVELQDKYSDKPVQIVCICSSSLDKTDEFLDSDVDGDSDADTYIDLLNSVSTAADAEETAIVNYMIKSGIPTAWTFIVGPTGKVEWLGRPTDVKKPLAEIVKGKWDRKAFAKTIEAEQKQTLSNIKIDRMFAKWMAEITKGPRPDAEELLEKFAEGAKDPANKAFRIRIETFRMTIMMQGLVRGAQVDGLEEDLPEVMRSVTKLSNNDSNLGLNNNAWQVYEMYEADIIDKDSELMKAAYEMAEKALTFRPKSGAVNDTVAHFVYLIDNDLERAIKLQKIAIKNSEDTDTAELENFLKFLKKEEATGKKKSLQKKQNGDKDGGDDSDF